MKTLLIAEKPSVARDLANALGRVPKEGDHFENDELVISSAVGHLVELFMPDDFDEKLKRWSLKTLPIIPQKFQLKPIESSKDRFQHLKKLMARKDIGVIVNACDAGREGELIFQYLYDLTGAKKPVKRMWMQSMTGDGIRQAWQHLRDGHEMEPLASAARCRSEADWLIGINGTRAVTVRLFPARGSGNVATVGRVQTPTLSLVVERERIIRAFKPVAYWRLVGHFQVAQGAYEGVYQRPDFKKGASEDDRADRLWDHAAAQALLAELRRADRATVTDEVKRTREASPRLYDLTTLQREANNRFGLSAGRSLQIAQALYEKYKVITYPRTDSRALPEDYLSTVRDTLLALEGDLKQHAQPVIANGWVRPNKRIFNNAEVSDHFAIIPTGTSAAKLEDMEAKLYDMIARRFVAAFYPAAEFDVTTRSSVVTGRHSFKTEGKVLAVPGWRAVYGKEEGKDILPGLSPKDGQPPQAKVLEIEEIAEATKPPPRFTEATLLSAMEGAGKLLDDEELAAAMKEKGLGTPATRASIIDHLVNEKYLERDRRDLVPTGKAEQLYDFLTALDAKLLTSPSLTGEWEYQLRQMEEGKFTRAVFMKGIAEVTAELVEKVRGFDERHADVTKETDLVSPSDGLPMIDTVRAFESRDGKVRLYKTVGGRLMSVEEYRQLLSTRVLGPLDGFVSAKSGKKYSALLRLDDEFKAKFDFGNNGGDGSGEAGGAATAADLAAAPVLGACPNGCQAGAHVLDLPSGYTCEHAARGTPGCTFRIGRQMLGKAITAEEMRVLLAEKKSPLIKGFRSNKTKRLFDAFLILKAEGKLGFEFPPREAKPKAAGGPRGRAGRSKAKANDDAAAEAAAAPTVADEPF